MQQNAELRNWEGAVVSRPRVVTEACSVEDVQAVLRDPQRYPAPVRAVGSNHSTTHCGVADGGTVIEMGHMNRILEIGEDTVTAEAGALYLDVAEALRKRGLQFYVNVELGNLTIGSAACGGTKDASMPGEFGQVNAYVEAMKIVTPDGEVMRVDESQPRLLWAARSSYGLFGVVCEVTFRVQPLRAMILRHRTYRLDAFERILPQLQAEGDSIMMYIEPFLERITVEFRRYREDGRAPRRFGWQWRLRNFIWSTAAPLFANFVTRLMPIKAVRYGILDCCNWLLQRMMWFVRGGRTSPPDQIIRYGESGGLSKYTFSIWAFDESDYPRILREYVRFCRDYYREHGYRCNLLNVGYRISADDQALLSYSFDGTVMTVDPVATGDPGWEEFLRAYNAFCSREGGRPLFNQTKWLTREQVAKAFGDRLDTFREMRRELDPNGRLLNAYFADLLAETAETEAAT